MKKTFLSVAVLALSASVFASSPKRLASFTTSEHGVSYPTSLSYNESGKLNKIVDEYSTVSIDYSNLANGKLTLNYDDKSGHDDITFDITVNELGLATSAVETQQDGDVTSWEFFYSDGKLAKITTTSDEDTEYIDLSWQDDLITSYTTTESYDLDIETVTFDYSGVTNTGNLMLLDDVFGIDLDELQYLAVAGFMGAAPRELPTGATIKETSPGEKDEIDTFTATWETDSEGYPIKLTSSQEPSWATLFTWEEDNAGIDSITTDGNGTSKFYTLDGKVVNSNASGLVIEKKADGTTVKHVIRQ